MDYAQLVGKCKQKQPQAQQELYSLFKNRMMGICLRYASQKAEAEDVFQEAMIKVFNKIDTLQEPSKLQSWVRQIIINTAINYYHDRHNIKFIKNLEDECPQETGQECEAIVDKLSNSELIAMVNNLPDGYRIVFNLFIIDGYKHQEIAKMLNISVGTSKSQLHAAKTLLQKQLLKVGIKKYERI
jgi:RNA polymerase sigma factor (sigma-70 family)